MGSIQFLQVEFKNTASSGERYAVMPNEAIPFDTEVSQSKDSSNVPHISYSNSTGEISFSKAGTYFVNWFVAQQTGLSIDGANFALEMAPPESPARIIVGSGHVKIAASSGFAILNIPAAGTVLTLTNTATHKATLSEYTQVKAGIAVFSVAPDIEATNKLGYAHAQIEVSEVYATGTTILFPVAIKYDPDDIVTYDAGIFTLAAKGTYLVTWEIPIEATDERDEVYIELFQNGTSHSISYAPLPIGVVSGSALIVNNDVDGTIQLKIIHDEEGDEVHIGTKANIVITQISNLTTVTPEP